MPRYYFHLRDGDILKEDPDGAMFKDLDQARGEARAAARDMLAAKVKAGDLIDGQTFEITDEQGQVIEVIALKSVLRLE